MGARVRAWPCSLPSTVAQESTLILKPANQLCLQICSRLYVRRHIVMHLMILQALTNAELHGMLSLFALQNEDHMKKSEMCCRGVISGSSGLKYVQSAE